MPLHFPNAGNRMGYSKEARAEDGSLHKGVRGPAA